MGLPQEVVDRIMDALQDDKKTLKACSLTCKAMFASTRHLIHQTLRVTSEISQRIFTPEEKKRYRQGDRRELEFRFLSFMGERGLLKYTRHLNIRIGFNVSPDVLEPHLRYFQSLDRIHTLIVRSYAAALWHNVHNTYFMQFYPTLTTLALYYPGHYRCALHFVLQFPNLENLTLKAPGDECWIGSVVPVPPVVTQRSPLRGHFRCAGLGSWDPKWTKEFAFDLPNGINFRSAEFRDVRREHGQQILDGCADSLEEFTVRTTGNGERSHHLIPSLRLRPKVLIHIFRLVRTGIPPIPGKQVTPIHRSPYPISRLRTGHSILPGMPSDHHFSRFL